MNSVSIAKRIFPSEALLFYTGVRGFCADIFAWIRGTMRLAERMSTRNKGHSFFVIHSHATKGLANVTRCRDGIRFTIRTFRVHVDESHLHSTQRTFKLAVSSISVVAQPLCFRTPIDFFLW